MAELSFRGVSRRFEGAAALDGIDLRIGAGEFVALLGPSGCGKSTLLRLAAGFDRPDAGEIALGGRVIAAAGTGVMVPPEDRNIGIVFQSYALWPHLSVAGNVSFPLEMRRVPAAERRARVAEALAVTGLSALAERAPAQLSGGQRQRVALARCLVAEPAAVLLDEPLANLDLALRATMQEAFRAFHARTGATMLYVTHDQTEALALADRVAVMEAGRIRQIDRPERIYSEPGCAFVAGFVGEGAVVAARPAGPLSGGRIAIEALGRRFEVRSASARPNLLSIRPEALRPGAEGPGAIPARVRSCTYTGRDYRLSVETEHDSLEALSPTRLRPGETLGLALVDGWAFEDPAVPVPARTPVAEPA